MHATRTPVRVQPSRTALPPHSGRARVHRRAAQLLLIAASLAAAACADHVLEPTPGERAPAVPGGPARAFAAPVSGAVLTSASLPVPPDNSAKYGAVPWKELAADFGDAEWVELRTTGQVQRSINWATQNVEYRYYCFGPDNWPAHGEGVSGGAGFGSGLRMTPAIASGLPAEDDYGSVMLDAPGGQLYRLSRVWPGARLFARRSGISGVCMGSPWYSLSGEHTVVAHKVVPVQVMPDRESFRAGEVLTWTTRLYDGITRLRWSFEGTDGVVTWTGCSSETCEFAPPGPGRMKVYGEWTRAAPTVHVHGYSPPVTDQPAKLKLTCTGDLGVNRVTRGATINCTASTDSAGPPGEIVIAGWSFGGRARMEGNIRSVEWKGIIVQGGTVRVRGTVGGQNADPADATLAVEDRSWEDKLRDPRIAHDLCVKRTDTCLQSPPEQYQDLGKTHLPRFEYSLKPKYIDEGPNTGWWYFPGQVGPVELPQPVTLLHPDIFDPGSDFYRTRSCNPTRVQRWITEHEAAHVEIGRRQLRDAPINRWLERQRTYSPNRSPNRWYNIASRRVALITGNLMDPGHELKSQYPSTPCNLRVADNTPTNP